MICNIRYSDKNNGKIINASIQNINIHLANDKTANNTRPENIGKKHF